MKRVCMWTLRVQQNDMVFNSILCKDQQATDTTSVVMPDYGKITWQAILKLIIKKLEKILTNFDSLIEPGVVEMYLGREHGCRLDGKHSPYGGSDYSAIARVILTQHYVFSDVQTNSSFTPRSYQGPKVLLSLAMCPDLPIPVVTTRFHIFY